MGCSVTSHSYLYLDYWSLLRLRWRSKNPNSLFLLLPRLKHPMRKTGRTVKTLRTKRYRVRRLGRVNWKGKQEPLTTAFSKSCRTTERLRTPRSFLRSQAARNSGWRPPAFLIGAHIPSTASSLELNKQGMTQRLGDRDGAPTENVMAHPLPTTASAPI